MSSTEQKATDQNALATKLSGFWTSFKQGKIIGYKWMALLLIAGAAIGVAWYITSERRSAASKRWVGLEEANTPDALKEISNANPGTMQDKLARLQLARGLVGESGIELFGASNVELRSRGVENVVQAREMFQTLKDDFKDQPLFKAQCLLGLAKAEAALVAVPTTPGQLTEFKGQVPKVIEYLDQLAEAAPDTPWATDAKKLADTLKTKPDEFINVQRSLFSLQSPTLPKADPFGPGGGLGPLAPTGGVPGLPGGK